MHAARVPERGRLGNPARPVRNSEVERLRHHPAGLLQGADGLRGAGGHRSRQELVRTAAGRARLVADRDHSVRVLHPESGRYGAVGSRLAPVSLHLALFACYNYSFNNKIGTYVTCYSQRLLLLLFNRYIF